MAIVDVEARLDLIQLATHAMTWVDQVGDNEMVEMIEALCRHRDLSPDACLSPPRVEILRRMSSGVFDQLVAKYGWDVPE